MRVQKYRDRQEMKDQKSRRDPENRTGLAVVRLCMAYRAIDRRRGGAPFSLSARGQEGRESGESVFLAERRGARDPVSQGLFGRSIESRENRPENLQSGCALVDESGRVVGL